MKYSLFLAFLFLGTVLSAQSIPEGMTYQAVARDLSGKIVANQNIGIKITLTADATSGKEVFAETHQVITNELGLFSIVIGEGTPGVTAKALSEVPWSEHEIWMNLAVDMEGGTDFMELSSTRLLTVPYAFHAGSAERLVEGKLEKAAPAFYWKTTGNTDTYPGVYFLGTIDYKDLILKTNSIERIKITADGNVFITGNVTITGNLTVTESVDIGKDLTVKRNVYLNTESGETLNNGNLTVTNQSATLLSGTLTVDEETDLNTSLNVDGPTNLQSSLNVRNLSPTILTGTLRTDGLATFNADVLMTSLTNSLTVSDGALVLYGGLGVAKNLNIGGASKFGGPVGFGGAVSITDETQSDDISTGALIVSGGVGIAKNLNVGQDLDVIGKTILHSTFKLSTSASVANVDPSTPNASKQGTGHVAFFENTSDGSGIIIKVGAGTPHNKNNFITFLNSSNGVVGRIEGEDGATDYANNQEYQDALTFADIDIALAASAEAISIAEEIQAILAVTAASTSTTVCAGLGACITGPIPSLIVSAGTDLVLQTANLVVATANLATVIAAKVTLENTHDALKGITFASGAEDYAEYLPKLNEKEDFLPGELVGMKNGFISKDTKNADRIMVISHNPAVLGGLPLDENVEKYEMVAFLGQIPTLVMGKVEPGDYILASGFDNGYGIAKNPAKMQPSDYKKILGVAWSESKTQLGMVNVAIGLNANDVADLVAKQDEEIKEMKAEIAKTQEILASLVPGYKEAAGIAVAPTPHVNAAPVVKAETEEEVHILHPDESNIIYYEPSREEYLAMIESAKRIYLETGRKIEDHPFWNRITTDSNYKEEIIQNLKEGFDKAVHYHKEINESIKRN